MTDVSPVAHSDGCDPVWVCDEVSPSGACGVGRHPDWHVARAYPNCLEHAVAQLSAVDGPRLLPDRLGLAVPVRSDVPLRMDVRALLPALSGRADVRSARASSP